MRTRIIIALDPPKGVNAFDWSKNIIKETKDLVTGYKIGLPLLLRLNSINELKEIAKLMYDSELRIVDLKLADIGSIMVSTVEPLISLGFNSFIAHAFVGLDQGLLDLSLFLRENNCNLITVVSMSHKGSQDIMDENLDKLLDISIKASSWGVVIGATKPDVISYARKYFSSRNVDMKILSPGIGVQGARPGSALEVGADYEIIGRLITRAKDPRAKVIELSKIYKELEERGYGAR